MLDDEQNKYRPKVIIICLYLFKNKKFKMKFASEFGAEDVLAESSVPLDTLPVGSRCRVVAMDDTSDSLLRLMEMGLIPGASVFIERTAPFRSPYSLRLSGCTLAIR